MDGQGKEMTWKVGEFENKAVFRKFIYFVQKGKECGATLTGKNLLPWGGNSLP